MPSLGVLSLKQWANPCSYGCFIFREVCRERFFTGLAIGCNQSRNDFVRLQSIVLPSNVDTNETEGSLVLASWLHLFIFHWFAPLWIGLGWNVRPLWQDGPPWPCLMDDEPRKCLPCPSMSRLLFRVLWWHWILIRRGRVARQVSRSGRFIRPSEMYIPHACLLLMLQSRNKSEAVCAVLFHQFYSDIILLVIWRVQFFAWQKSRYTRRTPNPLVLVVNAQIPPVFANGCSSPPKINFTFMCPHRVQVQNSAHDNDFCDVYLFGCCNFCEGDRQCDPVKHIRRMHQGTLTKRDAKLLHKGANCSDQVILQESVVLETEAGNVASSGPTGEALPGPPSIHKALINQFNAFNDVKVESRPTRHTGF